MVTYHSTNWYDIKSLYDRICSYVNFSLKCVYSFSNFLKEPSVYSAFRSLGIIQLPCSKTVKGYMNQTCKSPGIIEDNFLLNSKRYEEYIEKRKRLGFVSPKHEGILIWDETKVSDNVLFSFYSHFRILFL